MASTNWEAVAHIEVTFGEVGNSHLSMAVPVLLLVGVEICGDNLVLVVLVQMEGVEGCSMYLVPVAM